MELGVTETLDHRCATLISSLADADLVTMETATRVRVASSLESMGLAEVCKHWLRLMYCTRVGLSESDSRSLLGLAGARHASRWAWLRYGATSFVTEFAGFYLPRISATTLVLFSGPPGAAEESAIVRHVADLWLDDSASRCPQTLQRVLVEQLPRRLACAHHCRHLLLLLSSEDFCRYAFPNGVLALQSAEINGSYAGQIIEMFARISSHMFSIDFTDGCLGPLGTVTLAAGLAGVNNLSHLDISNNVIQDEGVAALAAVLPRCRITHVSLKMNSITAIGVRKRLYSILTIFYLLNNYSTVSRL